MPSGDDAVSRTGAAELGRLEMDGPAKVDER
jgi:hypothetical protein